MLGRIIVAVFVILVITAECVLAYLLVPSAEDVAAETQAKLAEQKKAEEAKEEGDSTDLDMLGVEVELGAYNVTIHQPTANSTVRVNFKLAGTVRPKDRSELEGLLANNEFRLREKVLIQIRDSNISELNEPGLGLIKRRILETSNNVLGKPLLTSIVFGDFVFHEQ